MIRRRCIGAILAGVVFAVPCSAQIAFDNATDGGLVNPGTSLTFAHVTGGGSNRALVACAFGDNSTDAITGATYNGVAMTLVAKVQAGSSDRWTYAWYLLAPASGSNNVVISASSSIAIDGMASSYTGVAQSGQPDASNTHTSGSTSSTSDNVSVTVVAANSWLLNCVRNSLGSLSSSTLGSIRENSVNGLSLSDSNGTVSTGSNTITSTASGAAVWGQVAFSLSPAGGGGGGATVKPFSSMLLRGCCDE